MNNAPRSQHSKLKGRLSRTHLGGTYPLSAEMSRKRPRQTRGWKQSPVWNVCRPAVALVSFGPGILPLCGFVFPFWIFMWLEGSMLSPSFALEERELGADYVFDTLVESKLIFGHVFAI